MSCNDIGINPKLDWKRIRKLLCIGLFGAVLTFFGDWILGSGVMDESRQGLEAFLSIYLRLSDAEIFRSAFLGFVGISLEGLSYFGIYRLIVPYSPKLAHTYRTGIFGSLMFAACGVHVPCLAAVYVYKHFVMIAPEAALDICIRYALYFLVPAAVAFFIFFLIQSYAHIKAFAAGCTPYPRWCWVFCMPVAMAAVQLLRFAGNNAAAHGITAAWLSIANIWSFGGLLVMMKQAQKKVED